MGEGGFNGEEVCKLLDSNNTSIHVIFAFLISCASSSISVVFQFSLAIEF